MDHTTLKVTGDLNALTLVAIGGNFGVPDERIGDADICFVSAGSQEDGDAYVNPPSTVEPCLCWLYYRRNRRCRKDNSHVGH